MLRVNHMGVIVDHMENNTDALDRQLTAEVRRAAEAAGISQLALAEQTGIPYTTLARRLNGVGKGFTVAELLRIIAVLGISLTELSLRAERTAFQQAA